MNFNTVHNQQTPQQLQILQMAQQAFREQGQLNQQRSFPQLQQNLNSQQIPLQHPTYQPTPQQQQQQQSLQHIQALQHHPQIVSPMPLIPKENMDKIEKPYIKIIEQPSSKPMRFRYECEGRFAGTILGKSTTTDHKSYPTIEIVGYVGRAVVVVSCVTKDPPYRPHPYNLVGKKGCKKGVYTMEINKNDMRAVFGNLGIQCVKKREIAESLRVREEIRVDPFKTGFEHRNTMVNIDYNAVRLCFQVFIENFQSGRVTVPIAPVVTEPIINKSTVTELTILQVCGCSSSVLGNTQMMVKCEKIVDEDISVRFYEENEGEVVWEAYGSFTPIDIHKHILITLKTPQYNRIDITEPVKVLVQLLRPSDGATSEPVSFIYKPTELDLKRKRQRNFEDPTYLFLKQQVINQNQIKAEVPSCSPQTVNNFLPVLSPTSTPNIVNEVANDRYFDGQQQLTQQNSYPNWNISPTYGNIGSRNVLSMNMIAQHHPSGHQSPDQQNKLNVPNYFNQTNKQILNIESGHSNNMDLCTENLRISDLLISS